jgi:putative membrane protein
LRHEEKVYYVSNSDTVASPLIHKDLTLQCRPGNRYAFMSENALRHLINWLLSALAVWVVSQLIRGFHVSSVPAALIAALVIGLVNATLGVLLKIVTFPLTILTLGIFWFVINALMLELASAIVPGFKIDSFVSAFWGAIVLSLVNMLFRWLAGTGRKDA